MSIDNVPVLTKDEKDLMYETIFRLTDGLPAHELEQTLEEAIECEKALLKEIEILEADLAKSTSPPVDENNNDNAKNEGDAADDESSVPSRPIIPIIPPEYDATLNHSSNFLPTAEDIMNCELSPLDRYFTVSSLLGRLREPFDTNPPPHSQLFNARRGVIMASDKKKKTVNNMTPSEQRKTQSIEKYKKMIDLKTLNEIYTEKQTDITGLLALVKRISNHRTAAVFRKAVNPSEAPGYVDRIKFPSDMALLKKFVLCGYIRTFQELHQQAGLIVHNCVKFNGRDSDYSIIAKDFEHYVDDSILDIMQKRAASAANSASSVGGAPTEESVGKQKTDDATETGS